MSSEYANTQPADHAPGVLGALAHVFGGWHFPVVALTLVLGFALMVVAVMLAPAGEEGFAAFAAEFKRWCFDWDGSSAMPIVPVLFMISELLVFALVVAFIWWTPLRQALRLQRRALLVTAAVALVLLTTSLALLIQMGTPAAATPPSVHDLRTSAPAPGLRLVDQTGATIDLSALRGDVALVTAVYATCGNTCPMLLGQAKRAMKALQAALPPELMDDLHVLAITLDPARDTPAVLTEMAAAQSITSPPWHLLGGPVAEVEGTLDRWEVARKRNPETGQIDHANLFMLVDRQGRLAYRLGLSEEREPWLIEALTTLLREPRDPASP